jgi:hypothetical protein
MRPIYAVARAIIRPIAVRTRAFLLEPLTGQLDANLQGRPDLKPRDGDLSPELIKSIETLLLTIMVRTPHL